MLTKAWFALDAFTADPAKMAADDLRPHSHTAVGGYNLSPIFGRLTRDSLLPESAKKPFKCRVDALIANPMFKSNGR